ncbi:copper resistance protein NlpE [Chitinophaga sp. MM2321]|uniref:copper resistance protein NlpE n=1 Tax=Chitinophaga sp. MM2321 TaxID=3137178 RepID=UPI0032D59166
MRYLSLLLVIVLAGCQHSGSTAGASDTAGKKDSWITYTGTLPCADCIGIITELTLHEQLQDPDFQFKLKETYQGVSAGKDAIFNSEGSYRLLPGNGDTVVIQLNPDKDRNLQRFFQRVGERELKLLDRDKHPIEGNLNYSLTSR